MSLASTETIRIIAANSPSDLAAVHRIRRRVFIEEQRVPEEIELDDDDATALHALAISGTRPLGCGRMVAHGKSDVQIGRMAVLSEFRRAGIGRTILEFLMCAARERGCHRAILHAQLSAEGFYLKQGFIPYGDVFEEAGIAHRAMSRDL